LYAFILRLFIVFICKDFLVSHYCSILSLYKLTRSLSLFNCFNLFEYTKISPSNFFFLISSFLINSFIFLFLLLNSFSQSLYLDSNNLLFCCCSLHLFTKSLISFFNFSILLSFSLFSYF
jgi:hypothetical protein